MDTGDDTKTSQPANASGNSKPRINGLTGKVLESLQKEYVVVGKTRVRGWHAWLIIGLMAGTAAGVMLVANRSGEFEETDAQTPTNWVLHPGPLPTLQSNPNLIDGLLGDPSVIKADGIYTMYYGAAKGDFSDTNTVRIFRATSNDGVTWKRNSLPVLVPGPSGSWDSVKVETPSVIRTSDGIYKMYYVGSNIPDSEVGFQVGLATSRDGISWDKFTRNPIIKLGSKGDFDEAALIGPTVVYKDNEYWMWYGGISGKPEVATGLAKSKDGINWEKKGFVMTLDVERESIEDVGITENFVLWNGQDFEMFYAILLDDGKIVAPIWHAVSKDGINWVKENDPIIDRIMAGQWTNEGLGAPSVVLEDNKYRMWFSGAHTDYKSFFEIGIGLAEKNKNTDGKFVAGLRICTLAKASENPLRTSAGEILHPSNIAADPFVIFENGIYRMWFTVFSDEKKLLPLAIAYAESANGIKWNVWKKKGTSGEKWDDYIVLKPSARDWNPVGIETASVVKTPGGRYFMYYTGDLPPEGSHLAAIGLATSPDGIHWTKYGNGPIFQAKNGWEQPVCDDPTDQRTCLGGVLEPSVIYDANKKLFKMWYAGLGKKDGVTTFRIGYATSTDGITWARRKQPVLNKGVAGAWDELWVSHTNVVRDPVKGYHLFYFGTAAVDYCEGCDLQPGAVGHAYSFDGIRWERNLGNPILAPQTGKWDAWLVGGPSVIFRDQKVLMWYFGQEYAQQPSTNIGLAKGNCE